MTSLNRNVAVSEILKNKSEFEDEPKKKSREDWRKAKELEEARKAGTAPAAVDEEGRDINPHIPQYISAAPWYYGSQGPTLKHQRPQPEKQESFSRLDEWYKRGVDGSSRATKFRKGACENCGAMTHSKKDCMERPRKVGAKFSGTNIAADEFAQPDLSLSYDGKRDRWVGYDPAEHKTIIEEFQKVEEAKRHLRAEKLSAEDQQDSDNEQQERDPDLDNEEDEDKYADGVDMPGTKVDSKQRITVRNLRIREDTAKYLRNLDPNSAYYDPKTRSMRDNPLAGTSRESDAEYAGENFVRFTGDTRRHATAQIFAWEAYGKGVDVHLLAEPTKLEKLQQEFEKRKDQFKSKIHESVLEKYGGKEHLDAPPKALLLAQTEEYVEYSRLGKVIKGKEQEVIRSRYPEDVYTNNHTSVWGSFWRNGEWGYRCCHSFIKNSYCLGDSGKTQGEQEVPTASEVTINSASSVEKPIEVELTEETGKDTSVKPNESEVSSEDDVSAFSQTERTKKKNKKQKKSKKHKKDKKEKKEKRQKKNKDESDSEDSGEERLKKALEKEEKSKADAEKLLKMDERKRPYNSMYEHKAPTEEELEAYYLKRKRPEDPMSQFLK